MDDIKTIRCVIDCRISSTKQADGNGLDMQEQGCLYFANTNNWEVIRIFKKSYSGRAEAREDFEEIKNFLKSERNQGRPIDYYLVRAIDRFTRNGYLTYAEMKRQLSIIGVSIVDTESVVQPEVNTLENLGFSYDWSMTNTAEIIEMLKTQQAKSEVTQILTRMIGAEIALTKQGYRTRCPNDGYINKKVIVDGKKRTIMVPDPKRAHFFIEMFNLRAQGNLSDKEIVTKINAMGFKTKPQNVWFTHKDTGVRKVIAKTSGHPLTVKTLQKYIKRPIYTGIVCEKWTHNKPIRAAYEGLVSVEVFNLANRGKVTIKEDKDTLTLLYNHQETPNKQKRQKYRKEYHYDKMVLCPKGCGKPTLSSANTGKMGKKFPAYHCNRSHCGYWRVPQKEFETVVDRFLDGMSFNKGFFTRLERCLIQEYKERKHEVTKTRIAIDKYIKELQAQQSNLLDAITQAESPIVRRGLEKKIVEIEEAINSTQPEQEKNNIQESDINRFISYATYLMEHPKKTLRNNDNPYKQKVLWSLVFDGVPTYTELLNGTPKLSPLFALSNDIKHDNSLLVNQPSLEWNSWEELITHWLDIFDRYDVIGDKNIKLAA